MSEDNNEEETAAANAHGWRHTGDLGFKDAEGWIFLVDRKRDMIITGGFNVFPAEIEKIMVRSFLFAAVAAFVP